VRADFSRSGPNQRATYPDPHVAYPGVASGVVCVVEIKEQFWTRYKDARFVLGNHGIEIGRGGVVE
jgi:hypothetical protein